MINAPSAFLGPMMFGLTMTKLFMDPFGLTKEPEPEVSKTIGFDAFKLTPMVDQWTKFWKEYAQLFNPKKIDKKSIYEDWLKSPYKYLVFYDLEALNKLYENFNSF